MQKQVIFFQGGGGKQDYETDAEMVTSLSSSLGAAYPIHFPLLDNKEVPDFGRAEQISRELSASEEPVVLVGHSLGASMLLKYLSEKKVNRKVEGVFLLATPFWSGKEEWVKPLKLKPHFQEKLNNDTPLFFYHCRDDEEVPFSQMSDYKKAISWATFRELPLGGHQFDRGLDMVAKDIRSL